MHSNRNRISAKLAVAVAALFAVAVVCWQIGGSQVERPSVRPVAAHSGAGVDDLTASVSNPSARDRVAATEREGGAPSSATVGTTNPGVGRVVISVIDDLGSSVDAEIQLSNKSASVLQSVSTSKGLAEFEAVPTGECWIAIVPESLDDEYAPAFGHDLRGQRDPTWPVGYGPSSVVVRAGELAQHTLVVPRSLRVSGTLRSFDGRGIEGAVLRLASIHRGMGSMVRDTTSGPGGAFEFEAVAPLRASVAVLLVPDVDRDRSPIDGLPFVTLEPESGRVDLDLRLGSGPIDLVLRTVDEDGNPLPGINVVVHANSPSMHSGVEGLGISINDRLAWVWTDDEGYLELRGLPNVPMRVRVGQEEATPTDDITTRRAKESIIFDLEPDPSVDARTNTRRRHDLGAVTVEQPAWFKLVMRRSPERADEGSLWVWRVTADERKALTRIDGTWSWSSTWPVKPFTIEARTQGADALVIPVSPERNQTLELELDL